MPPDDRDAGDPALSNIVRIEGEAKIAALRSALPAIVAVAMAPLSSGEERGARVAQLIRAAIGDEQ